MIRRHVVMSAAAAGLLLSSCGGKKDDVSPSPTPTPTDSPSPSPTASPTYAAFPLAATAAAEFVTINATTSYTGDLAGEVTLGAAGTEGRTDRVRLATSGAITTNTTDYVIREATEEGRFKPTNLTTPSAAANPEFVFESTATGDGAVAGNFSRLLFLNNVITSSVSSDALVSTLTRVSYGVWHRGVSTAGKKSIAAFAFGYPTVASDLPKTGTFVYTARVSGKVVNSASGGSAVNKLGGDVTISVNQSTGLVSLSFALTQTTAGGVTTALPTFSAEGAIPTGQNQFNGSITSGSTISGTIAGGFFGSAGNEIGLTLAGSGLLELNSTTNIRIIGVTVGKLQPPS